jgi:site-specific DNA-methyltransferase (adenine-specific)
VAASRDVLKTIPDCSIDSIVTDPPYALVSIVKRFGAKNAAAVNNNNTKAGKQDGYANLSKGFMGKSWDTGETAFAVDFWAECLRVLKPGGHVVAFSGTRTYHRMACAIEDAGFEVRDMLSWLYGFWCTVVRSLVSDAADPTICGDLLRQSDLHCP